MLPSEPWRRRHSKTLRAAPEDSGRLGQFSPAPGHASVTVENTQKEHLLLLAEQLRHHSETRGSGESMKGRRPGRHGGAWVSSCGPHCLRGEGGQRCDGKQGSMHRNRGQ